MKDRAFTLIELLIVISIIGILAAIAVPAYIGQQRRASRTEAYTNLETIRLLEEQRFADRGEYVGAGTCGADNPGNIALIQDPTRLPRFQPGSSLQYSYCIENDIDMGGNVTSCFRASAFGNSGTRVRDDVFRVDCNNNRNF